MNYFQNIPPKAFTLSAVVVGFLILEQTDSANEQNAIGNWLMLVSQLICTNAVYRQIQTNNVNGTSTANQNYNYSNNETLQMLQKTVNALNIEIEEIKRNM